MFGKERGEGGDSKGFFLKQLEKMELLSEVGKMEEQ